MYRITFVVVDIDSVGRHCRSMHRRVEEWRAITGAEEIGTRAIS
jgi:hypothetical protein